MHSTARTLIGMIAGVGFACSEDATPREQRAADTADSASTASASAGRCYRSPHSVLFGPPTGRGQQGRPPGWVRLEGVSNADSGAAELLDADGKALRAVWRRRSRDSVHVIGADDFLRVELRLVVSSGQAVGHGDAHSDAALERDSQGRLGDLRRSWDFTAVSVSCDSMSRHQHPGVAEPPPN